MMNIAHNDEDITKKIKKLKLRRKKALKKLEAFKEEILINCF